MYKLPSEQSDSISFSVCLQERMSLNLFPFFLLNCFFIAVLKCFLTLVKVQLNLTIHEFAEQNSCSNHLISKYQLPNNLSVTLLHYLCVSDQ